MAIVYDASSVKFVISSIRNYNKSRKKVELTRCALCCVTKFAHTFYRRQRETIKTRSVAKTTRVTKHISNEGMKKNASTSMASGSQRSTPSKQKIAKPEGVSNSTVISPQCPKLVAANIRVKQTQEKKDLREIRMCTNNPSFMSAFTVVGSYFLVLLSTPCAIISVR